VRVVISGAAGAVASPLVRQLREVVTRRSVRPAHSSEPIIPTPGPSTRSSLTPLTPLTRSPRDGPDGIVFPATVAPLGTTLVDMSVRTRQIVLAVLAVSAADVGIWAELDPAGWYRSFPGFGLHWLPVLGPYNEHLSRDVGGLYLALLVLSVGTAVRASDNYLVRLTAGAWLAFSIPHLIFHLAHLDMYGTRDQVLNLVSLGGTVVLATWLLLAPHRPAHLSRTGT
jgi:hypothetical protein